MNDIKNYCYKKNAAQFLLSFQMLKNLERNQNRKMGLSSEPKTCKTILERFIKNEDNGAVKKKY